MEINLIDLYYEAANLLVARSGLDVASAAQEAELLKRSYGAASPVDYSNPLRRYAYLKSMAPRHAVIWREYVRAEGLTFERPAQGTLYLNSIGAGPAPEVFGILEGAGSEISRVDVRCLEAEKNWSAAGGAVAELYRVRTGKDVSLTYVDSAAQLHRGAYTIGSMVISDLVRAGTQALLHEVRENVAPAEGVFLDTTKCRSPDGQERYTSRYVLGAFTDTFVNFTGKGYLESMRLALEKETESMSNIPEYELATGFMYNGYPMRFT